MLLLLCYMAPAVMMPDTMFYAAMRRYRRHFFAAMSHVHFDAFRCHFRLLLIFFICHDIDTFSLSAAIAAHDDAAVAIEAPRRVVVIIRCYDASRCMRCLRDATDTPLFDG